MSIIINEKEYEFNENPRWGILEYFDNHPNESKALRALIKEILIPSPTNKELFEFRKLDLLKITQEYEEFQKAQNIKLKKKLSK